LNGTAPSFAANDSSGLIDASTRPRELSVPVSVSAKAWRSEEGDRAERLAGYEREQTLHVAAIEEQITAWKREDGFDDATLGLPTPTATPKPPTKLQKVACFGTKLFPEGGALAVAMFPN
jgi:hypothetical protein